MKLLVMGDLHYHEIDATVPGLAEARDMFYRTVLKRFLDTEAELHISLGDLTNLGTERELREVYELLRREDRTFIHVPGNHDLYSQPREHVLALTGQRSYRSIDTEAALLVFLDTSREMDTGDWSGWLDEDQLRWLEARVEASGTKPLLVFAHHPVYRTTAQSEADKGSIHPDIDMWRILQKKRGTGVYFNGHTHVDSIVSRDNWTFVQLSACLDEPGFRLVELDGERIAVSAIDVTDEGLTNHAAMLHRHMTHYRPNPEARGQEADRGVAIVLPAAPQPR